MNVTQIKLSLPISVSRNQTSFHLQMLLLVNKHERAARCLHRCSGNIEAAVRRKAKLNVPSDAICLFEIVQRFRKDPCHEYTYKDHPPP